jgi:hypothetical protein
VRKKKVRIKRNKTEEGRKKNERERSIEETKMCWTISL